VSSNHEDKEKGFYTRIKFIKGMEGKRSFGRKRKWDSSRRQGFVDVSVDTVVPTQYQE